MILLLMHAGTPCFHIHIRIRNLISIHLRCTLVFVSVCLTYGSKNFPTISIARFTIARTNIGHKESLQVWKARTISYGYGSMESWLNHIDRHFLRGFILLEGWPTSWPYIMFFSHIRFIIIFVRSAPSTQKTIDGSWHCFIGRMRVPIRDDSACFNEPLLFPPEPAYIL